MRLTEVGVEISAHIVVVIITFYKFENRTQYIKKPIHACFGNTTVALSYHLFYF